MGQLELKLVEIVALRREAEAEPVLLSPPVPQVGLVELESVFAGLVVLVRGIDSTSKAVSEHVVELRQFGVLNDDVNEALHDLARAFHLTTEGTLSLLDAINAPFQDLHLVWSPLLMASADRRFVSQIVRALRYTTTKTSILGSRPIVRLIATCFALSELCKKSETLFEFIFSMASDVRNKQKRRANPPQKV
jgi:hypothetical protein